MRWIACLLVAAPLAAADWVHGQVQVGGKDFRYRHAKGQPGAPLAVLAGAEAERLPLPEGWGRLAPETGAPDDPQAKAIELMVAEAFRRSPFDAGRIYLCGPADLVFYSISRTPDLWAAAVAAGSAQRAVESGKLYAINSRFVPALWIEGGQGEDAELLSRARFRFEKKKAAPEEAVAFLASHQREPYPYKIDCETGSPAFARCFWLQPVKFDPARRNDVLSSTRVAAARGAKLALGDFGFSRDAPGPGVLVERLPEGYQGPLKTGDRIIALAGAPLADAKGYWAMMEKVRDESAVAVMIDRGGKRQRLETRYLLPPPPTESVSARVRAEFTLESKELIIISRTVTELRLMLPAPWGGASVNWNGVAVEGELKPGCWILRESGRTAQPCGP